MDNIFLVLVTLKHHTNAYSYAECYYNEDDARKRAAFLSESLSFEKFLTSYDVRVSHASIK